MHHIKTYYKEEYEAENHTFILEGPLTAKELSDFTFDDGLDAFRPPIEQFEAIKEIADLEEGRILIIREEEHIIGYVTYLHPDPMERWSDGNLPYIMELGAVEVSLDYRSFGLGKRLLKMSMQDEFMENYIIITTEYYWHWDLKNSGLDVYEYKDLMIRLMASAGFEVFQTNDPEITGHPANTLMARIGRNIKEEQMMAFDKLRFKNRFFF
ncbi:GNAT family N-acetyltransferase [Salinicoccus roseus]|uniref:Acetoin dehydrogenase n=1 Tax=Salinicoccus roseus TaxID=45670 RepID=A0A0C2HEE1_9STAP|nr:GNAT family N-acetyltransferase [Salinicoccus roseus]KIH70009.1 acetoin dehydrogenase [Salinicoccus roseus]MDB0581310.1 GNAT family N-acetyltransferase [Salinicoccus roseus]